jgi:hypothetical protein
MAYLNTIYRGEIQPDGVIKDDIGYAVQHHKISYFEICSTNLHKVTHKDIPAYHIHTSMGVKKYHFQLHDQEIKSKEELVTLNDACLQLVKKMGILPYEKFTYLNNLVASEGLFNEADTVNRIVKFVDNYVNKMGDSIDAHDL